MTIKEFYEWAVAHKVENYPLWNITSEKNIEIYPNEFVYIMDSKHDSNSWLYD